MFRELWSRGHYSINSPYLLSNAESTLNILRIEYIILGSASYSTTLRCHLMAKHCLKVSRNQNLRQEIHQHVAQKVWWRDLQSCWECSSTCYAHIQCQTSTTIASLHLWGATWWTNTDWEYEGEYSMQILIFFVGVFLMKCSTPTKFLVWNGMMAPSRP